MEQTENGKPFYQIESCALLPNKDVLAKASWTMARVSRHGIVQITPDQPDYESAVKAAIRRVKRGEYGNLEIEAWTCSAPEQSVFQRFWAAKSEAELDRQLQQKVIHKVMVWKNDPLYSIVWPETCTPSPMTETTRARS